MKKRSLCCILIAVALLILCGCQSHSEEGTGTLTETASGLNIYLGMTQESYDDAVDNVDEDVMIPIDDMKLDVTFVEDTLIAIDCEEVGWDCGSGIQMGSSRDDIMDAFGEPDEDNDSQIGYTFTHEDEEEILIGIGPEVVYTFTFDRNDNVSEILIYYQNRRV